MAADIFRQYSKSVLIIVGLILTILAIAIVALRLYVRRRSRVAIGLDDWFIVVAAILCTGSGAILVIGGLGQQQELGPGGELIHSRQLTNYEKCRYAIQIISTINLGIIKASILLFYRRLFTTRSFAIANNVMLGIVAAWTAAFASAIIAQCSPVPIFWEKFEIEYLPYCINVQMMYQGLAISDLILDVLVLVCPIPVVVVLNLPWRKKIAVIDILLLGAIVLASGVARIVSFQQVVNFTSKNAEKYFKNTTYYTAGPVFWNLAENAVAIIGACLPTLAPLWRKKAGTKSSSKRSSYLKPLTERVNLNERSELNEFHQLSGGADHRSSSSLVIATQPPASTTNIYSEHAKSHQGPRNGIHVQTTLSAKHSRHSTNRHSNV